MRHIAIIGSGPAGCYLAEQLLRAAKDTDISIIERLPSPFGLVRYGVAPDHQGTKAISRLFERVLGNERVRFFGNVTVGQALTLNELLGLYDAVVLATGAPRGRNLGVAGESLPGVFGSDAFVGWYNSQPGHPMPELDAIRSAVVIGNGNVAVDVVRLLAKEGDELAGSDLAPGVTALLARQPLRHIHMVGRRGPEHAKFTQAELSELGRLQRARPVIVDVPRLEQARTATSSPVLDTLAEFAQEQDARETPVRIQFHFGLQTTEFVGGDRLEAVRFRDAGGNTVDLPAELAVTCIGYQSVACSDEAPEGGHFVNQGGHVRDHLYVTGWAGRGPSGTIPTNRAEAKQLAARLATDVAQRGREGAAALARLLAERGVRVVDHGGWQRLDQAERERATPGRCRHKFESADEMLAALDGREGS